MSIKKLYKKDELGRNLTHNTVVTSSIIANKNVSSTNFGDNSVLQGGAEWYAPTPYLTNTNKSTSTPVEKSGNFDTEVDFTEESLNLYIRTKKLYKNNKKGLQYLHNYGLQRFKMINPDNVVLYKHSNSSGNPDKDWNDSKKESNTKKARLTSKNRALEKVLANVDIWEYFVTFTFDPKKKDRFDFDDCKQTVTRFLRRRNIDYFLAPETHKNGAIHFHALCSAELGPYLAEFSGKALRNPYIAGKLEKGEEVFHCSDYTQRFGYNIVEPCRNKEACALYMTKYVLKTFDDEDFVRFSRRRFFCSTGLKTPEIVSPDSVDFEDFEPVAYGKYCPKVYLKRYEIPEDSIVDNPPSH